LSENFARISNIFTDIFYKTPINLLSTPGGIFKNLFNGSVSNWHEESIKIRTLTNSCNYNTFCNLITQNTFFQKYFNYFVNIAIKNQGEECYLLTIMIIELLESKEDLLDKKQKVLPDPLIEILKVISNIKSRNLAKA
jgi:hypothetical protein